MNHGWLAAEVQDGQFDDERVATFTDAGDRVCSFIVPRSLVVMIDGRARVSVRLLDARQGLNLIELPGDTFGCGREVTVSADKVSHQA